MRKVWALALVGAVAMSVGVVGAAIEPAQPVVAAPVQGWSALGGGASSGTVFQIAEGPDGLYVGGTFTSVLDAGGTAVGSTKNIARWNPTTSAWTALAGGVENSGPNGPNGADSGVFAVAYDAAAGDVWIGGDFASVRLANNSIQSAGRLARWRIAASDWVSSTPGVADTSDTWDGVEEIVVTTSGTYIGGYFGPLAGNTGRGFARYVAGAPGSWASVGGGLGIADNRQIVNGMTPDGTGGVIITGQFTTVSNPAVTVNRVARWDGTTWSRFGNDTSGVPGTGWQPGVVAAVASTSAGVVIGGNFATVTNSSGTPVANTKALALWNGTDWVSLGAVQGVVVEELRVIGNYLYAGGVFSSIGGVTANNIARYNLGTQKWEAITDLCANGVNGSVRTIIDAGGGAIYVGGAFTDAGGVAAADRIAKYTPSSRGCPASGAAPQLEFPAPGNFRVSGITPDRVDRLFGQRVHLTWDAPVGAGYRMYVVTTKGRVGPDGYEDTPDHSNFSCWTLETTCSIFFPFTSNNRRMHGRQFHQVTYTVQGYNFEGKGLPATYGPMIEEGAITPSAPRNVRVEAGLRKVTVTWDPPASYGLTDFAMNYLVRSSRGNVCITRVNTIPESATSRTCTFNNVKPATYTYRVEALSVLGWGAASGASARVTPYDLFITNVERSRPRLAYAGGTRAIWRGAAPNYPQGTVVTPFVKVGAGQWQRVGAAGVRVGRDGTFSYTRDLPIWQNNQNVFVKFSIGDTAACARRAATAVPCTETAPMRADRVR